MVDEQLSQVSRNIYIYVNIYVYIRVYIYIYSLVATKMEDIQQLIRIEDAKRCKYIA